MKKTNPVKTNVTKQTVKPLQKLKNTGYFILVLVGVYALIYGLAKFASWSEHRNVLEIKGSNTATIGTIVKVGSMKGSYAVAEYFVDGKRYERKDYSPANDIFTGEYYLIIYKATNPAISRLILPILFFLVEKKQAKQLVR